ncbi:MAG: cytochrome P450 [Ilumatobacteraceae bacterium]
MAGVLVMVGSLPLWWVASSSDLRRVTPRRARLAGVLASATLVAGALGAAIGSWIGSWIVVPLAVAVVAVWVALAWRARPTHGRRRGLPPGSLSWRFDRAVVDDQHLTRLAARHGRVFRMSMTLPHLGLRPMVCIVDNALGLEVLRRHEHSLAVSPQAMSRFVPGGVLREMQGAAHYDLARSMRAALSDDVVAAAARQSAISTGDALAREWSSGAVTTIDPRMLAERVMDDGLHVAVFGLAPGCPTLGRLHDLERALDGGSLSVLSRRHTAESALAAIADAVVAAARGGEATAPSMLHRVLPDLDRLDAPGRACVLGNLTHMAVNGRVDTAGLAVWCLRYLAQHPSWWSAIAESPGHETGSVAQAVVLETLRLDQSEFVLRRTTAPIDVDGHRVPAGWMLRLCVREAHRSTSGFVDADHFDPGRFLSGPAPTAPAFAPFGLFRHTCIGAALTRSVVAAMLSTLACTAELCGAEEVDGRRHGRFHWEPDPAFRLSLGPRPTVR